MIRSFAVRPALQNLLPSVRGKSCGTFIPLGGALTGFVRSVHQLYVVRFLGGLAEAGLAPSVRRRHSFEV